MENTDGKTETLGRVMVITATILFGSITTGSVISFINNFGDRNIVSKPAEPHESVDKASVRLLIAEDGKPEQYSFIDAYNICSQYNSELLTIDELSQLLSQEWFKDFAIGSYGTSIFVRDPKSADNVLLAKINPNDFSITLIPQNKSDDSQTGVICFNQSQQVVLKFLEDKTPLLILPAANPDIEQ